MKVLIIGYGSIGKRHFEILNSLDCVDSIDIITKQDLHDKNLSTFNNLELIETLNRYDYFIIASETTKHYEQLKYICNIVREKKILVEKPLFDKNKNDFTCNNKVFTAYNLRFHPTIDKIKQLVANEEIYFVNTICGQYLPSWRPGQDYRKSYSADIKKGGGVLRDLSHELDYLTWMFGNFKKMDSINTKISDLDINSDDIFTAIAVTDKNIIINITVDYISKAPLRELIIHTKNSTIIANVIKNKISIHHKNGDTKMITVKEEDRNYSYTKMHESIINNDLEVVCSFNEGKKLLSIIDGVEFKELA